MDNVIKYKLSNYRDIKALNSDETVILCYDISSDRTCVKRYIDKEAFDVYYKLRNIKSDFLPEIYDILKYNENYIVLEEYIIGKSIEEKVNENGCFSEKEAAKYILDVCRALEAVHSLNIIHRDISPNNVIIDKNGNAVLLDFDIAREGNKNKSTDTTILGTVGFASPEQFGFAQTNAKSDIYSLGVLFNYMLTGKIIQREIYKNEPFYSLISKATKIDSSLRYTDINEFIIELSNSLYNQETKEIREYKFKIFLRKIPGFRTNKRKNKIIAVTVYGLYVLLTLDYISERKSLGYFLYYTISYLYFFIVPMWWFGNNGKQWDMIPLIKKSGYSIKKAAAIILYIIILVILAQIMTEFSYN